MKIKVEGYSPERFFNLCNVHKILLWGIEKKEVSYELFISVKDYKKLRPLVRKTGTKVILIEKIGFPFFLYKFRKRKIFFVGMILCTVSIYLLSLFIWNIHFEGNVTQKNAELLSCLENHGIYHGIPKKAVVCEEIEQKLRSSYPNILWVSAEIRGTRIIIQIKENTDQDIISRIVSNNKQPTSMAADCSGKIESMVVRKGTPVVRAGDTVEEGEILVEGYYAVKNDAGEVVRYETVPADADIIIALKDNYSDEISLEYQSRRYTGKKKYGIKLLFYKKSYEYIPKNQYKIYETIEKTYDFRVTENFYLPVSITLFQYLEYDFQTNIYTENELKKIVAERFLDKYENILQKGVQIIEKDVKININGKLCHVTGNVILHVPATKKIPVVLPELKNKAFIEGE